MRVVTVRKRLWKRLFSFASFRSLSSSSSLRLDVEQRALSSIKDIGKASQQEFHFEDARLKTFSEERIRWALPHHSAFQEALSVTCSRFGIHVLGDSPLMLHTFRGTRKTKRPAAVHTLDLSQRLRSGVLGASEIISVNDGKSLVLFGSNMDLVMHFKPSGGNALVSRLPLSPSASQREEEGKDHRLNFFSIFGQEETMSKTCKLLLKGLADQGELVLARDDCIDVMSFPMNDVLDPVEVQRVHLHDWKLLNLILCSSNSWYALLEDPDNGEVRDAWITRGERNNFELTLFSRRKFTLEEALGTLNTLDFPGIGDLIVESLKNPSFNGKTAIGFENSSAFTEANVFYQRFVHDKLYSVPRRHCNGKSPALSLKALGAQRAKLLVSILENERQQLIELVNEAKHEAKTINTQLLPRLDKVEKGFEWVDIAETRDGEIVTLQKRGPRSVLRLFELDEEQLKKNFDSWREIHGISEDFLHGKLGRGKPLELRVDGGIERVSSNPPPISSPKHGKDDPLNKPHVGGNTFAGGTGGSDTAGLGGRGGPYRLNKGHPVHQVSDDQKRDLDRTFEDKMKEEFRQKALDMVDMDESDFQEYKEFRGNVSQEIAQLKAVFESIEQRKREREWLRNESYGELDDSKLVDCSLGERLVFKRRGTRDPVPGTVEQPKRLLFLLDNSASMIRFNHVDQRFSIVCWIAMMVMEALQNFPDRYRYAIVGHSGSSESIPLVDFNKPPETRAERLEIVREMISNSAFAMSGDTTLEATEAAIEKVTEEDADDYLVVVVSDANLRRYGISGSELGDRLVKDPKVNAHAILIGSFGNQAEILKKELPPDRGHIVNDTGQLPTLFRDILLNTLAAT